MLSPSPLLLRTPSTRRPRLPCALAPSPLALPSDSSELGWEALATSERHSVLSRLARWVTLRRTVDEAEFALTLEADFNSDPTILRDIDFSAILSRLRADMRDEATGLAQAAGINEGEIETLQKRQRKAEERLAAVAPRYARVRKEEVSAVAQSVPKLRRVISKARELPLAVELQRSSAEGGAPAEPTGVDGGFDLQAMLRESQNLASATRELWQRLNGGNATKDEELMALQRESKALLSLRAETTKLRAGIRLVNRQKELKRKALIRYDAEAVLEEMLRADLSIMKLQIELSLKADMLEMERIYLAMEGELRSSSTLTDQLLPMVERYGSVEQSIRKMVSLVQSDQHEAIDDTELNAIESEISDMILQLGLQQDPESFTWRGAYEAALVGLNRALQGIMFYLRGLQLMGQDIQLFVSMITRAVVQGYTLRQREVNILRRIAKDLVTIVPVVIILLIPLSPIGHVLVFSFIQRYFPDFFPSQFTEERQNIMSMYSSLTAPTMSDTPPPATTDEYPATAAEAGVLQPADEQPEDHMNRAAGDGKANGVAAEGSAAETHDDLSRSASAKGKSVQ